MSTIQPNYLFLNNPAAADVTLANRILTLGQTTNSIALNVQKVKSLVKVEGVAAVAKSQTLTVTTATVGQNYALQITQQQSEGQYDSHYISYEAVTGDTTNSIATAIAAIATALINTGAIELTSAIASSNTVPFVGITTNPVFTLEIIEGPMTLAAASPAGNEAFGQGTDLLAAGITGISAGPVAGTSYDALFIDYGVSVETENTINRDQAAVLVVYYNEAGASLAAFLTALNAAIANATANPELINLSDTIA
jgi:hypothetical protein